MRTGNRITAVFIGWIATQGAAEAAPPGARANGRAGVGIADGQDVAAVDENLGAVSLVEQYSLAIGAGLGPDETLYARGAAVDTRTSPVALGAGYYYLYDNITPSGDLLPGWLVEGEILENPAVHQGVFLGLAYPFAGRKVGLGVVGRVDWLDSEREGEVVSGNFGFTAAGKPIDSLTLAAGAYDLLDLGYRGVVRHATFGIRFAPGTYLAVEGGSTILLDGTDLAEGVAARAAADVFAVSWLALRGGYGWEYGDHVVSGGVGFVAEGKAAVDYGIRYELTGERLWHALDVRAMF